MTNERRPIYRAFYRKLLAFYPKSFRERFGESMEQTFDDLCKEREERQERTLSLTVRVSFDTGVGIIKEHILHLSKRSTMTSILINPKTAAVAGFLLFLPGAIMFSLLMAGIEPPLGPLNLISNRAEGPHILGSLVLLGFILLLPAAAVAINIAATGRNALRSVSANLGTAAIIGLLLVLPFMILESIFGQTSYTTFPFGLFAILWLLPAAFAVVAVPVVKTVRAGSNIFANPATLFFRVAFLVIVSVFWVGLLVDQMPCFLGVPNCD